MYNSRRVITFRLNRKELIVSKPSFLFIFKHAYRSTVKIYRHLSLQSENLQPKKTNLYVSQCVFVKRQTPVFSLVPLGADPEILEWGLGKPGSQGSKTLSKSW